MYQEAERTCELAGCGANLADRRSDARFCGSPCRAEAHRDEPRGEAFWRRIPAIRRKPRPRTA